MLLDGVEQGHGVVRHVLRAHRSVAQSVIEAIVTEVCTGDRHQRGLYIVLGHTPVWRRRRVLHRAPGE